MISTGRLMKNNLATVDIRLQYRNSMKAAIRKFRELMQKKEA